MRGGNTYAPAVQLPVTLDDATISASQIRRNYAEHDAREDQAVGFIHDLFSAVLRGNQWAVHHAPTLLPVAFAAFKAADAACDAGVGLPLGELFEALDSAKEQLAAMLDLAELPGNGEAGTAPTVPALT